MTVTENSWEQPAEAPAKQFYKRWRFIVPVAILIAAALFIAVVFWIADKQESRARDVALAQCKQKISQYEVPRRNQLPKRACV